MPAVLLVTGMLQSLQAALPVRVCERTSAYAMLFVTEPELSQSDQTS